MDRIAKKLLLFLKRARVEATAFMNCIIWNKRSVLSIEPKAARAMDSNTKKDPKMNYNNFVIEVILFMAYRTHESRLAHLISANALSKKASKMPDCLCFEARNQEN